MIDIKYIGTLEAKRMYEKAGYGQIHQETIRTWFEKYDLGAIKIAGTWRIDKEKFQRLLEGKHEKATETPITTG